MKTRLVSILLLLFAMQSYGQGNLQFNEVKFIEINAGVRTLLTTNGTYVNILDSVIAVVPIGKVWKIENISMSSYRTVALGTTNVTASSPCVFLATGLYAKINDKIVLINDCTFANFDRISTPIWLKPGTYILKLEASFPSSLASQNGTTSAKAFFSAIEFNVVP